MRRSASIALALAVMSSACDNGSTTSPSVMLTLDTFMGTLQANTGAFHVFTATQAGDVHITLTAAGPPPTISMGLYAGVPDAANNSCSPIGPVISARADNVPHLTGQVSPGQYCVAIFDIGNQAGPIDYVIEVEHP